MRNTTRRRGAERRLLRTTDAFIADPIMDGNLGMPFLRHWVLTLDLQAGLKWIAPAVEEKTDAARD